MSRIVRAVKPVHKVVMGIDASLTSTGYAYREGDYVITGTITTKLYGPARLAYIEAAIMEQIALCTPDLIVYEDYAISRGKAGKVFSIGELGGILKTLFWKRGIDVMIASPTALKKAITGRGDADKAKVTIVDGEKVKTKDKTKPEMRAALANTFQLDLSQNDEADACGLMLMGEMRFGSNTVVKSLQNKLRLDTLKECSIIHGRTNV